MIVAYPLTSQSDYTELRYSLRSIDLYLPKPFEVVIIGDKIPDWISNVTWIQLPDVPGRKQLSIRRKILAALHFYDEIFCMADDIYLSNKVPTFEYYFFGSLKNYSESGSKKLCSELLALKRPIKRFDIHCPIVYTKEFKAISELFTTDVILKSMYCNYMNIEGIEHSDFKFIKSTKFESAMSTIESNDCFSTGNQSLPSLLPILAELFPNKSIFEL